MPVTPELRAHILRYYHVEQWRTGTIARQLKVHHGTVERALRQAGLPRIGSVQTMGSGLVMKHFSPATANLVSSTIPSTGAVTANVAIQDLTPTVDPNCDLTPTVTGPSPARSMRRVAVTGMGVISPLGNRVPAAFEAVRDGHSGIGLINTPFTQRLLAPIAATVQFDGAAYFEPLKLRMLDRVSQFAVVAANQALADAAIDWASMDRARVGVFVGTGMGGTLSNDDGYKTLYGEGSDRIKPFTVLAGMHNAPAAWIGLEHALTGPNLTYSTACSSSAVAIGEAWLRVASGAVEMAIAGGSEAPLSFGSMKAWEALHTLASIDAAAPESSCKPFSKNRSGMVLGEGAAMLVLEDWDSAQARGATIQGELLGYGLTTDASHITRPSAAGQAGAMAAALRSCGLDVSAIDAINAHGTGTLANDAVETAAIKAVFGARAYQIPVSATKALHGHLLGAAGALECALSLRAMQQQVLLPTLHLLSPDPACDLDYVPNVARSQVPVRTMLSNSFAFGGTNAVLVLRAAG